MVLCVSRWSRKVSPNFQCDFDLYRGNIDSLSVDECGNKVFISQMTLNIALSPKKRYKINVNYFICIEI